MFFVVLYVCMKNGYETSQQYRSKCQMTWAGQNVNNKKRITFILRYICSQLAYDAINHPHKDVISWEMSEAQHRLISRNTAATITHASRTLCHSVSRLLFTARFFVRPGCQGIDGSLQSQWSLWISPLSTASIWMGDFNPVCAVCPPGEPFILWFNRRADTGGNTGN